ncbi:MAG: TonB-dependent receptor [Oxalicibacterium faecigallinarum]|uniref:TonB-dependent receptor n=1 Tax=Oxalicibacterium faecigallinarum TaxID=573741 RepID=UPI0028075C86|nr:TonB-dependent receptor [Oxalicibacterium faecigallinarum]MDQ7969515.1 TonB-dependent receptor [Oxalicibacterium faecigallinarum]
MLAPLSSQAQVSADEGLTIPDVTVTAERRSTSLQKTPVAVNSVSADELEQKGVRRLADLNGVAPGVSAPTSSNNGTTAIFIRGIGASRPIGNPSVGLYLDDVYLPRTFGAGFYGSLPDVERVEILRGPQGTLYGQNTSAGAVKFISKIPGQTREAWVSGAVGNNGALETRGYYSTPINPGKLSASVAFVHDEKDGELYNTTTRRDAGIARNTQLRTLFNWTPTDDFSALLSIDGTRFKQDWVILPDPRFTPGAGKQTAASLNPTQEYQGGGLSLKLNKKINQNLEVKSITAYRKFDYWMPTGYDYTPARIFGFNQDLDQRQISQEFQLSGDYGRFNFITGLSLFREVFEVDRLSWRSGSYNILRSKNTTDNVGLFGQGNYKLTEKLNLSAGLRLNHEKKGMDASGYASNASGAQLAQQFELNGLSKSFNAATPKLSLSYQWNPDLLTYASWSKGETSGGYNSVPGNAAIGEVPINPEKVTTYEIGIKSNDFGGRVKSSATFFYNDYDDYQASISNPIINGVPIAGSVIVNAGKAKTYGVELESAFKATSRLETRASLAYLKTEFVEFANPTGAANTNLNGAELPNAPKLTASLGGNYTLPLQSGGVVRFHGNARYQKESYSDISASRESTKYPAQTYVDVGTSYTTADGLWTAFASVKNLFDKQYTLPGIYNPQLNLYGVTYNPERRILVGVRRDF